MMMLIFSLIVTCFRSSHQEMFLREGVLKICSKFMGEHPCRSMISIKLLCNFYEIELLCGCSFVNLLHNFRTPFPRNTARWLLLLFVTLSCLSGIFPNFEKLVFRVFITLKIILCIAWKGLQRFQLCNFFKNFLLCIIIFNW